MTPITPERLPSLYSDVTRVNGASCGSSFSTPIVIVGEAACARPANTSRQQLSLLGQLDQPLQLAFIENSG